MKAFDDLVTNRDGDPDVIARNINSILDQIITNGHSPLQRKQRRNTLTSVNRTTSDHVPNTTASIVRRAASETCIEESFRLAAAVAAKQEHSDAISAGLNPQSPRRPWSLIEADLDARSFAYSREAFLFALHDLARAVKRLDTNLVSQTLTHKPLRSEIGRTVYLGKLLLKRIGRESRVDVPELEKLRAAIEDVFSVIDNANNVSTVESMLSTDMHITSGTILLSILEQHRRVVGTWTLF
jgi:hypothetical protein